LKVHGGGARSSLAARASAVALGVFPVAAWAALAAWREPSIARDLFFGQHLGRAIEGVHHRGPPWQYVQNMLAYQMLPWTPLVVLGVIAGVRTWRARRRGAEHDVALLRANAWLLVLLVSFSISSAKRDLYLLPAYPAAALLAARWFANTLRSARFPRWIGWIPVAVFTLLAGACCAAQAIAKREGFEHHQLLVRAALAGVVFALAAFFAARMLLRGDIAGWARAVARGWCAGLVATVVLLVPLVDPAKSDRELGRILAALPQRPSAIPCFGTDPDGARFYGGVPTVLGGPYWLRDREPEEALARDGAACVCLMEASAWNRLGPERQARFRELARQRVGSDEVLVLGMASAR
jgi:4-amino-4-deoxy-L-arabinose transferase-like glycosyltransferase